LAKVVARFRLDEVTIDIRRVNERGLRVGKTPAGR
jgi:hypothetical protein